ncbi:hypothetical protein AB0N64_17080 [Microbacterium sp. NPDC089318]
MSDEAAAYEFVSVVENLNRRYPDWRDPSRGSQHVFNRAQSYFGKSTKKHPGVGSTCRQLGCLERPIQNSHTIAESALKRISVQSHVISPDIRDIKSPKTMSVGQGTASTFNGYCLEHEKLFSRTFETSGFNSDFHYTLQLMRSTAREIWKLESYLGYVEINVKAYEESVLELNLPPIIKRKLAKSVSFPLRSMKANAQRQLQQMEHMLTWLTPAAEEGQSLPRNVKILKRKSGCNVALSGSTNFHKAKLGSGTGLRNIPPFTLVFTVLPDSSGSLLMFATSGDHIDLSLYIDQYFGAPE